MSDIIQLLPDSVANQIAAGEVIQRPASVVKELVENAIDAGATHIKVNIKDAGRTLIQVSDNGCGMSETDARMAFERHATSKISQANDLFAIRTMGFRGEALASIAAIAGVELRTKRQSDELGTLIRINGSQLITQEPVSCGNGSDFQVKNLFFNVPARRKFLKSNTTELNHIIKEIQRVALANTDIKISLFHNETPVYQLAPANLRQRIVSIFGKSINQSLIPVNTQTSVVNISGFIGQPRQARKKFGQQFFFTNKRYIRHPFFHHTVMKAYEKILPPDTIPAYFIFFDIDPAKVDINIHPTKTEVKFDDEPAMRQIIHASIRETLGKFNVVPSIDFDQRGSIDIPISPKSGTEVKPPEIKIDPDYNPFREKSSLPSSKSNLKNWEKLYEEAAPKQHADPGMETDPEQQALNQEQTGRFTGKKFLQFKNRYILTPVKSGLMVIDQKRAHERILFEKFMMILEHDTVASQQQLFPKTFELEATDAVILKEILDTLKSLGFDIREFGKDTFIVNGTPGDIANADPKEIVEVLIEAYKTSSDIKEKAKEQVARSLAHASAISYGQALENKEIGDLIDALFACDTPNYSPAGKKVVNIIPFNEFEKILK